MFVTLPKINCAVGDIISTGEDWQTANYPRKISRMALVGGAVPREAEVQVFYGQQWIATLQNFHLGPPNKEKMLWHNSGLYCPPGTPIIVKVTKAFSEYNTAFCADIVRYNPPQRRRF